MVRHKEEQVQMGQDLKAQENWKMKRFQSVESKVAPMIGHNQAGGSPQQEIPGRGMTKA